MRYASIVGVFAVMFMAVPGFVYGGDHVIDYSQNPLYLSILSVKT